MNVFRFEDPEGETPPLTPLIDVVFLVLVFFLVTSTYSKVPRELELELPESGQVDAEQTTELRVFVSRQGTYRFEQEPLTKRQLLDRLKSVRATLNQPVLLISADAGATHQRLVDLIVIAKRSGIVDFAFEIQEGQTL